MIAIIVILAGVSMSVMSGAVEQARKQRTRAIINKCNTLIMERYEGYRTRAVPVRMTAGMNARLAARIRLDALRELMRMELPCTMGDVLDNPVVQIDPFNFPAARMPIPSTTLGYRRRATSTWDSAYEGAECLYLIVSTMQDGDKNALDYFDSGEIGDLDEDGMKEILDGWGQPLVFLRWAPGFTESVGLDNVWGFPGDDDGNGVADDIGEAGWPGSDDFVPSALQTRNYLKAPDPFDPLKVDPRNEQIGGLPRYPAASGSYNADVTAANNTFALVPLIISMGPDKELGIQIHPAYPTFRYADPATYQNGGPATVSPPNDPYFCHSPQIGSIVILHESSDNITNHDPPQ